MATCADCRFARNGASAPTPDFRCSRNPPVHSAYHGATAWPRVNADDWCGEHQPEKPDAAASLSLMADAIAPFLLVANAAAEESGELLISTDLTDDEGETLNLSSADFLRLADAYARATGA